MKQKKMKDPEMTKFDHFAKDIAKSVNVSEMKLTGRANVAQSFANQTKSTATARRILGYFGYYILADIAKFMEVSSSCMSKRLSRSVMPDGLVVFHNEKPYYYYEN